MKKIKEKVIEQGWVEKATRLGFIVRGMIYVFAGLIGLKLALARSHGFSGLVDLLGDIRNQSYGQIALIITTVGLSGYSLWGFLRGLFNVLKKDNDLSGLGARLGYLISAVSYSALAWVSWSLLRGGCLPTTGPQKLSAQVLAIPWGRELLILVGIFWVIGCGGQIVLAAQSKFKRDLTFRQVDGAKKWWTIWSGKIGLIVRSFLFGLIGLFLVYSAWTWDPSKALDLGQLLSFLDTLTFGPLIVGILSSGLVVFGLFSLMQSQYVKYPQAST